MPPTRVALLCDALEEGWPSMDLIAEMILGHLRRDQADAVAVDAFRAPYRRRFGRLGGPGRNLDRLWNRFMAYPRAVRSLVGQGGYDAFHVVDHSYAQLVHQLPPGRSVVTCHDLDTFRCLLRPDLEPRPRWFLAMVRRILTGLQKASAVACVSRATLEGLLEHRLVPAERLHLIPNGTAPEYRNQPDPPRDAEIAALLGPPGPAELLHVGSTIPRKRIDVLLDVFAAIRRRQPGARLLRVGGSLTADQRSQADSLGLAGAITPIGWLDRPGLAAVYRRATLVLQPSEAEGFGLPVVEALACGTPVLASDIPALREAGGDAVTYRPVAAVDAWANAALSLLTERLDRPDLWQARQAAGLSQAARLSWSAHVARLVPLYQAAAASKGGDLG